MIIYARDFATLITAYNLLLNRQWTVSRSRFHFAYKVIRVLFIFSLLLFHERLIFCVLVIG